MWQGILPAVTTKFTAKDELDIDEMQRCFALQMQAGCTGLDDPCRGRHARGQRPDRKRHARRRYAAPTRVIGIASLWAPRDSKPLGEWPRRQPGIDPAQCRNIIEDASQTKA